MKRVMTLLLLMPLAIVASAQSVSQQTGISADLISLIPGKVYRAVENELTLKIQGVDIQSLRLTSSIGSITASDAEGVFILKLDNEVTVTEVEILVCHQSSISDCAALKTFRFSIAELPKPKASFGNIGSSCSISASSIKQAETLFCVPDSGLKGVSYTTHSYKVVLIPKEGNTSVFIINGATLNKDVKARINKLGEGDKLMIYDIKAIGPTGVVDLSMGLVFYIKG